MRSRLRLSAAAVLSAAALAGCGGGGDETTATPATTAAAAALTKEELVAQGNAICAEVNAAVGAVGSTSTEGSGQSSQVADLYGGIAERLQDLGAPSDDAAGYEELIGAAQQLARAHADAALAAERGESTEAAEGDVATALSSFQSAARAYGLDRCAEAPSAPAPASGGDGGASADEESAETGGVGGEAVEAAPESEEVAPETGGAGAGEEATSPGGGAAAGGAGGGSAGGGSNSSSGGIGPG